MQNTLDARIPSGPIEQKWDRSRFEMKLVNPANRRKHTVLIVGSGLAGAAAAAAPRPLDRRPGRDQRRQELPERRRQRLSSLLRHREGR